eukprot:1158410-Pelagomonas_calceolata.AAC.5
MSRVPKLKTAGVIKSPSAVLQFLPHAPRNRPLTLNNTKESRWGMCREPSKVLDLEERPQPRPDTHTQPHPDTHTSMDA